MTVHLPDAVAAVLEQRAAERGVSVAEFISELVERSHRRRALRGLIGSVDLPVDEPFDIHRARDEMADELLRKQDELSGRRLANGPDLCTASQGEPAGTAPDDVSAPDASTGTDRVPDAVDREKPGELFDDEQIDQAFREFANRY